eukprot:Em0009g556a
MDEESSDMDNVNDRYTLCTEEAEEQPTSAADDLHLEDRNVNVMENADAYQETEVVLDSDYDDLAFDCTGCSTPEGSKTGWFASDSFLLVPYVCSSIIINSNFMYQTEKCNFFFLS